MKVITIILPQSINYDRSGPWYTVAWLQEFNGMYSLKSYKSFLQFVVISQGLNYVVVISSTVWLRRSICTALTITYLLTPWSRVLLEKLTGFADSQEIPRIFGTRMFITVLTSARHLSLSWANSIQPSQPLPTSWRSILILSPHLRLGLPSGLFHSGLPTRILCTPLPSPIHATALTIAGDY